MPGGSGVYSNFCQAFLKPGDHVVTFEPGFAYFVNLYDILQLKVTYVPLFLKDGRLVFDREVLTNAFTDNTKVFAINSPHNPTGKVFDIEELGFICELLDKHKHVVVAADEVYYNLYFNNSNNDRKNQHTFFANLPGMWERTISLHSFERLFPAQDGE